MSDATYPIVVEIKSKFDQLTQGFTKITQGQDQLIKHNKAVENSFNSVSSKALLSADRILNKWMGLGTILAGAGVVALFNQTAEAIDNVTDKARGLGVSAQDFQKLSYGARLGGVSVEELESSLSKFNKTLGLALSGNKEAIDSFTAVGISAESLRGKSLATQYAEVATAASKLKDSNIAAAASIPLFGKNYSTALSLGRDGIEKNIEGFDKLGITLTNAQRKAVDSFNDSKIKLDTIFEGFFEKVVANSSPAFEKLINDVNDFIEKSGGIDVLATNVGNKIVDIVKNTIATFNALKPGFEFLLNTLSTLVASSGKIFSNVKSFTNSYSDNLSQGTTNGHASNPGVSDFLYDFQGKGEANKSWWSGVKARVGNLIHPFDVAPDGFNNYNPNKIGVNSNGFQNTAKLGASTNPYDAGTTTITPVTAIDKFSKAVESSTEQLNAMREKMAEVTSIGQGLKQLKSQDASDALKQVFGIVKQNSIAENGKTPAQAGMTTEFEKDAADLITSLKSQQLSSTAFQSSLNLLRQDLMQNIRGGYNTAGESSVIDEIQKYAEALGINKQKEIGLKITIAPSKQFIATVFSDEGAVTAVQNIADTYVANQASIGAHS